jgi:hypothetical protein
MAGLTLNKSVHEGKAIILNQIFTGIGSRSYELYGKKD